MGATQGASYVSVHLMGKSLIQNKGDSVIHLNNFQLNVPRVPQLKKNSLKSSPQTVLM